LIRSGEPEEIAASMAFIASDGAAYMISATVVMAARA
jgi:NAD(P)-dependent dehydrogenase (short-subunit alcohol dehydrogenase family)